MQVARPQRWDIFCTVIDNFGDIGVCWRLARQLVAEHALQVRLWVDDLDTFKHLEPEIDPGFDQQFHAGVDIHRWCQPFPAPSETADVVIEAFACELPESYVAAMARQENQPFWINLEYLSAEAWVAECHGLPSPHPTLPLIKHFFIPGFDAKSAGLLREQKLLAHHAGFDAGKWWQENGGARSAAGSLDSSAAGMATPVRISLFAYENRSAAALLNVWQCSDPPVVCLVTDSRILTSVSDALGRRLEPGDIVSKGSLALHALPFMRQEAYDDLLAACDLNFVRGEDSLVRAIWAGKPFVWHIYPQDDGAHRVKLEAFLERYCPGLSAIADSALRNFWQAWNTETATREHWEAYARYLPEITKHTRQWRDQLAQLPDLAGTLVDFCKNPL